MRKPWGQSEATLLERFGDEIKAQRQAGLLKPFAVCLLQSFIDTMLQVGFFSPAEESTQSEYSGYQPENNLKHCYQGLTLGCRNQEIEIYLTK